MNTSHRHRSRARLLSPLLSAILVLTLVGCQLFGGTDTDEPQFIVVEGSSRIDPMRFATDVPALLALEGPLRASADAPIDATIDPPQQRLMMAEAAARREALRALGRRILALPDADRQPLSQTFARNPQMAAELEQLLEAEADVTLSVLPQQVSAAASVPGSTVAALLQKNGVSFQLRLSDLPPERQQALKVEAYNQAMEEVRANLLREILAFDGRGGEALGEVFARHPERLRELEATLLLVVQADSVRYSEDGTCHVETYFDVTEAQRLARQARPSWWAFWR